ncbi:Panacea domain-containing protein [Rhizobium sp. Leaf341]|uniref:Panacea domain-containing protein n=1 Tax=Rhizobium sp. Leaf341 TaxID=1736344 RepID=UPI000715C04E|nr:type II toxin-antitoxin system antitoxin SocA domain-containing protein [Rhizobium sp. Leaf341]KQR73402.1 hypothetical protein ASG03_00895 [Rhizobium sp. Leaf341]
MYDARQIANWFVRRAKQDGKTLTIMQLLKLVYISHGWHLEITKAPLIANKVEAWKYGPVIPDVYNSFRKQGINATGEVTAVGSAVSDSNAALLEQIYNIYGSMSARQLSDLTHEPNGPWDQATKRWGYFAPIPDDLIRPHYEQKRERAFRAAANVTT